MGGMEGPEKQKNGLKWENKRGHSTLFPEKVAELSMQLTREVAGGGGRRETRSTRREKKKAQSQ